MHYPDVPFVHGQSYSFNYPTFVEGAVEFRRMTFECLVNRFGAQMIVGIDLNTGQENRWAPELMTDVKPYEPVLIPGRFVDCRYKGKSLRLHVYSCFPSEAKKGDYKITGKANGQFFTAWLSEIEGVHGHSEVCNG